MAINVLQALCANSGIFMCHPLKSIPVIQGRTATCGSSSENKKGVQGTMKGNALREELCAEVLAGAQLFSIFNRSVLNKRLLRPI